MRLSLAVFEQVTGRALEHFAERGERGRLDDLDRLVLRQLVAARDAQPCQIPETVGRQAVLGQLRFEFPVNRHAGKIRRIFRLDNSKVTPYYSVVPQLGGIMAKKATGPRYSVQPAGFPRDLWLVWDHERGDNLRGAELNPTNPPRFPWFTQESAAERIAARLSGRG